MPPLHCCTLPVTNILCSMITATLLGHLIHPWQKIHFLSVVNVKWDLPLLSWSDLQGPLCLPCSILVTGLGSSEGLPDFTHCGYSKSSRYQNIQWEASLATSVPLSFAETVSLSHQQCMCSPGIFIFEDVSMRTWSQKFLILSIHKNSGLSNFLIKLKGTGNSLSLSTCFLMLHERVWRWNALHLEINMLLSKGVAGGERWTIHPPAWC